MAPSLHLVNPRSASPSYTGGEVYEHFGCPPATLMADLTTTTVAALAPAGFDVTICDEACGPVDLDVQADFVGLTGKVNQWPRTRELAHEFRRRGRVVLIGGSYASLSPETVRPHCDVLVQGELEGLAEPLFADLAAGTWRREYVAAAAPSLDRCVVPRWDLYPNHRAAMGTVQTSRGCPFECEFCDVIVYAGRTQRHKPIPLVLAELDATYALGYRRILLADDNLTVHRRHARELLTAVRAWNDARTAGRVELLTQVSIEIANDGPLLALMADAGLVTVFIGIETPNEDSLRESKKRQNLVDLVRATEAFVEHGMCISGGMIVGFDHDGPDIFQRQIDFLQATPVGHVTIGALVAPERTPLHARLASAGRLRAGSEFIASPLASNVVPLGMRAEELERGLRWLCRQAYDPALFERRILRFLELFGRRHVPARPNGGAGVTRDIDYEGTFLLSRIASLGAEEARMLERIGRAARSRPEASAHVGTQLLTYLHARCLFERAQLWEPAGAAL